MTDLTAVVVMGVTGAGKTTVATALAQALGWRFVDADDLHPRGNIDKMSRNEPLTDADREPWLLAVRDQIVAGHAASEPRVIACSALKHRYRHMLSTGVEGVRFVYLKATREALASRLAERQHHFAGPGLLNSQFAALEEPGPGEAVTVDASLPPDAAVARIRATLGI